MTCEVEGDVGWLCVEVVCEGDLCAVMYIKR